MNASYQASLVNRHIRRFTGVVMTENKSGWHDVRRNKEITDKNAYATSYAANAIYI